MSSRLSSDRGPQIFISFSFQSLFPFPLSPSYYDDHLRAFVFSQPTTPLYYTTSPVPRHTPCRMPSHTSTDGRRLASERPPRADSRGPSRDRSPPARRRRRSRSSSSESRSRSRGTGPSKRRRQESRGPPWIFSQDVAAVTHDDRCNDCCRWIVHRVTAPRDDTFNAAKDDEAGYWQDTLRKDGWMSRDDVSDYVAENTSESSPTGGEDSKGGRSKGPTSDNKGKRSQKATVEEVEDEDVPMPPAKTTDSSTLR